MTESQTRHDSHARLTLRFNTANGPRTVIMSNLSLQDAQAIASTHRGTGQYAEVSPCGALISLVDHMAKHKRKLKVVPATVTKLAVKG